MNIGAHRHNEELHMQHGRNHERRQPHSSRCMQLWDIVLEYPARKDEDLV
jgi:hypothetical protein